jgi:hypothetical protein
LQTLDGGRIEGAVLFAEGEPSLVSRRPAVLIENGPQFRFDLVALAVRDITQAEVGAIGKDIGLMGFQGLALPGLELFVQAVKDPRDGGRAGAVTGEGVHDFADLAGADPYTNISLMAVSRWACRRW